MCSHVYIYIGLVNPHAFSYFTATEKYNNALYVPLHIVNYQFDYRNNGISVDSVLITDKI